MPAVEVQGLQAVPDLPQVRVARIIAVDPLHIARAARGSRDKRRLIIQLFHKIGQYLIEKFLRPLVQFDIGLPAHGHILNLIVAAPEGQARMMAQPPHVAGDLLLHALKECILIKRIWRAGKHEILPDEDAVFVTDVIKGIRFIIAAAPDADHIHMRMPAILEQLPLFIIARAGDEGIHRDIIAAFGEQRHAV